MKLKKFVVIVLALVLLQLPIVYSAETVAMPVVSVGGGGGGCNCPDAEEIADKVVVKLEEKDETKSQGKEKIKISGKEEADSATEIDNLVKKVETKIFNISEFTGDAREIIALTRDKMDTPLAEVYTSGGLSVAMKLLSLIGIDTDVLAIRDVPKIISCGAVATGGLWNYFAELHNCISNVINTKLEKLEPQTIEEKKREIAIESAFETSKIISTELVSTKASEAFGW
jgi:hypothetical protein